MTDVIRGVKEWYQSQKWSDEGYKWCAWQTASNFYILQIHSQFFAMLSFQNKLETTENSFANSKYLISIVGHLNLKPKLRIW